MLEGKGLKKIYDDGFFSKGKKEALCGADIKISKGETAAIVGESGSGKTTLVKILSLQIQPTEGDVFFNGEKMNGKRFSELKKIFPKFQLVPQNPNDAVDPRWSVEKSVAEPLLIAGFSKEETSRKVDALFEEVGLSPELKSRYPHELSGGELQRVVIARALSLEPEVIICDEATAMLDVSVQAYIMSVLADIKRKRNLTLIIITHDLALASAAADIIYVMNNGKIVDEGTDLFENPVHPYTKELASAMRYENLD